MPEEKKENGFTKFFHKVGKNISDANRESKLESAYTKDARKFSIYEDDPLSEEYPNMEKSSMKPMWNCMEN